MRSARAALALLALLLLGRCSGQIELVFGPDKEFRILQITDLHYSESEELDEQTDATQRGILEAEQPDLVVFSGDMITGFMYRLLKAAPGFVEAHWQRLMQPVNEAGIPYAVGLGNHDIEADLTGREVMALDARLSNLSLSQVGPEGVSGASNYWLDILDRPGGTVAARVWILDSNDKGCASVKEGWGCLEKDTLEWVAETAAALPRVPTSLAFVHIPLPQILEVFNNGTTNGKKEGDSGCPIVDTGGFDVLKDAGIQAMFSGHDHQNDYYGLLDGVRLGYGRKTGWGNIAPGPDQVHGGRVIRLRLGESAAASETWIRRETGEREDQPPTPSSNKAEGFQTECSIGLSSINI